MTRRPYVVAAAAVIALGMGACKSPRPTIPIHMVANHPDSSRLWIGDGVVASTHSDSLGQVPTIRLSRPDGPIERTLPGWLIGGHGDQVYAMGPAGADGLDLAVARFGLTDKPVVFGHVPGPGRDVRPDATVIDGGVAYAFGGMIYLIRPEQTRELPLLADTEVLTALVGNPSGPELVVGLEQSSDNGDVQRLVLVDTRTGEVRWQVALAEPISEGAVLVSGNRVLIPYEHEVVTYDLATGAATRRWTRGLRDAKNFVVDAAGDHLVFADLIGEGHGSWADPTCLIRLLDDRTPAEPTEPAVLTKVPGWCRLDMAFVDDVLWITPSSIRRRARE